LSPAQDAFDEAVKANVDDFEMEPDEAVQAAVEEFEIQVRLYYPEYSRLLANRRDGATVGRGPPLNE
jgi:hypothetical protein